MENDLKVTTKTKTKTTTTTMATATIATTTTKKKVTVDDPAISSNGVHIRIKKRTMRKFITIVEGLHQIFTDKDDLERFAKKLRKTLNCAVSIDKETNNLTIQGDHRETIKKMLVDYKIVSEDNIKIHGF